ncbi:hypothetical protein [Saccharopolyspora hattusasensis]|uniref:hypothetical protein n=1 Tax=Saccharopolyspora hattusasensis TaxID=1128679 RepID=UPI003D9A0040
MHLLRGSELVGILSAALLAVVAADQARIIAAVAGWTLAVGMGTGALLLLRAFGGVR